VGGMMKTKVALKTILALQLALIFLKVVGTLNNAWLLIMLPTIIFVLLCFKLFISFLGLIILCKIEDEIEE
jgi:uncharacterized protein (DUF58 family)